MILALKDEAAYAYNTLEEKEELLNKLKRTNYKIFSNSDVELAKKYANTDKIIGYLTDEMDATQSFKELIGQEDLSVLKPLLKETKSILDCITNKEDPVQDMLREELDKLFS